MMATVRFTSALQRFLDAPPAQVTGATVGEVLAAVFEARPALRGYVLDDQGAVRRHVVIYVKGEAVRDRAKLSDPIGPDDEIYVFHALTGG
jgi:sulfur-carrier protein